MRLSDEHLTAVARRRRIINHYDPDLGGFDPSSRQARPWVAGLLAFAEVDNHQVDTVAWDIVGALAHYQSEVVPGKRWEVGHARKYGLDPTQYQFGLGPYAIAPLNHPTFLFPGEPGFPGPSDMMVLGVDMNETIRAYPTWTRLVEFEVINENLGGGPVAVAF